MQIIVFDDVLSCKGDWIEDKNIAELLEKAKELNILAIFCFQFSYGGPKFIESVDCVFIMNEDCLHNRKRLFAHYGSSFKELIHFEKVIVSVFNHIEFNTLVIENKTNIYQYRSSNVDFQKYKLLYPCTIFNRNSSSKLSSKSSSKSSKSTVLYQNKTLDDTDSDYYFNLLANNKNKTEKAQKNININLRTNVITIIEEGKKIEITI
jgi:hypothetical protein